MLYDNTSEIGQKAQEHLPMLLRPTSPKRFGTATEKIMIALALWSILSTLFIFTIYDSNAHDKGSLLRKSVASFTAPPPPRISRHSDIQSNSSKRRSYAYAFLIAGCDPSNPTYMGYVYNVLVAAHILRQSGSIADIVALVRMATNSNDTVLPPEVEKSLQLYNVIIKYLPKAEVDSFHTAMMDKFCILNLVEYNRVLFLDADVMPKCNLDYMFHLSNDNDDNSNNAGLRDNAVLALSQSPANGGFFLLKPSNTDYLTIKEIQKRAKGRKFDVRKGWGHVIQPHDHWVTSRNKTGTNWTFYGAHADQGLLYYWVKYHKKSVSIIINDRIENWFVTDSSSSLKKEVQNISDVFGNGCASTLSDYRLDFYSGPFKDIKHFSGQPKPWLAKPEEKGIKILQNKVVFSNAHAFWRYILKKVVSETNMTLDVNNLELGRPTLGFF